MHCLMRHVPFIFAYLLQNNERANRLIVHKAWPIIEYMLKIDQIICSAVINEKDLTDLETFTDVFLTKIKQICERGLFPKLHYLTHYPNTIRIMGSIKSSQMMRGDAKHQPFTQYAKRCRNYMNICKTLSEKHQEVLAAKCSNKNTYSDNIKSSKKMYNADGIKNQLLVFDYFKDINRVMMLNCVTINSSTFAKGLFLIYSNEMHQINAVLKYEDSFIFLCTTFTTVKFYKFANCFEIEKSPKTLLIAFDKLDTKRTYEAKPLNNKIHIIADNLDMIPIYEKCIV